MKKIILLIIIFSVSVHFLSAQDETIYMHYTINPLLINPAAAGTSGGYNLNLNVRTQWAGFEGAPKTVSAFYDGPVGKSFGIGLGVMSETAAQLARLKVQMNFAFRFELNDYARLSTGFFTEFQSMRVVSDAVSFGQTIYQEGDELLDDILKGKGIFDAGLGVYATMGEDDRTFAGITLNNLVRSKLDVISTGESRNSPFSYYTFLIGHQFELLDWKVKLEPSFLIRKIREAPTQIDLNLKASFLKDQLIAGLSYRTLGVMGIMLGTKLREFKLYYSYDVSFQQFQKYNTGSHEVTVAFKIKKREKKGLNGEMPH